MFLATGLGALWWPDERALIVSDLHLEKGSNFACRGQLLPPYDTDSTLGMVEAVVDAFRPATVISLGDSLHDGSSERRLSPDAVRRIKILTAKADWYWVEGNHDPDPPAFLGGSGVKLLRRRGCVFRHEPTGEPGEISGHLHPVARIGGRGRSLRRKCYVTDGANLVMPSLGAYTGGLNVLDPAFGAIFRSGAMVFAANGTRVHSVERSRLHPDNSASSPLRASWRL